MKRQFLALCFLLVTVGSKAQELFVSAEPASVLPVNGLAVKLTDHYMPYDLVFNRPGHRLYPEAGFGIMKNFMLSAGLSFSNMHTYKIEQESVFASLKYRFLSHDEMHRHFRMAAFIQAGHTKAPFHYDDTELIGDKSGVRLGIIATQLCNRFAFSGSVANTQVLDRSRSNETVYLPRRIYQAMNYSLSAGFLLFPLHYAGYKQVNIDLYAESLAQQALDHKSYYIDLAPALQAIFFSNTKLSVSYRTQVAGNAERMSTTVWMFSLERSFLNLFRKSN